jgi:hypothetical protein
MQLSYSLAWAGLLVSALAQINFEVLPGIMFLDQSTAASYTKNTVPMQLKVIGPPPAIPLIVGCAVKFTSPNTASVRLLYFSYIFANNLSNHPYREYAATKEQLRSRCRRHPVVTLLHGKS